MTELAGPSAVRSPRQDRLRLGLHVFLGLITIALGLWAGLRWSLIAVDVNARITSTSWAEEGPDFKDLQLEGGRTLTIDDDLMGRLAADRDELPGRHLQTRAGSKVARLDGREVPLRWSSTASRTIVVLALIVVVSVVRRQRGRPTSAPRDVSG